MRKAEHGRQSEFDALFTGWRGLVIGLYAALGVVLSVQGNVERLRTFGVFGMDVNGSLGFGSDKIIGRPGWERVVNVDPSGAAAKAGLKPGAHIRFDHVSEANADFAVGRGVGLTALGAGDVRNATPHHIMLVAQPSAFAELPLQAQIEEVIYSLGQWLALALGVLVLVRCWGSLTALSLGLGLLGYSHENVIPFWVTRPASATLVQVANHIVAFSGLGLLLLPAALYADRIRPLSRRAMIPLGAATCLWTGMIILRFWCDVRDAGYPFVGDGESLFWLLLFALNLQGIYWSWRGRQDATGSDRGRFGTVLVATIAQIFNGLIFVTAGLGGFSENDVPSLVTRIALLLIINLLIPLSLAYAVLRHRVIDLGFVINRTIVYGSVSAILLASFGLIEWGVEQFLPEQWVKASAWIEAGAAVMVYLVFHRVHEAVERRVESVFFHTWRLNEEALRRFIATAPNFDDEATLSAAFADELSRFAGEGAIAIYCRNVHSDDDIFVRIAGSWDASPLTLARDDAAYAWMRTERRPLDLSETRSGLPGVLALPMIDHGALSGLVLMDLKPSGALFRPDEIALLGLAVHDVGLALTALRAGSIAAINRRLAIENVVLKEQIERLGNILDPHRKHAQS